MYFFRHGKTLVDNATPIVDWILTEEGVRNAQEIAQSGVFDDVDVIYSSTEKKRCKRLCL